MFVIITTAAVHYPCMQQLLLYFNAKYLHAIGPTRVTWPSQIHTVARCCGQQFTRATVKETVACCPCDWATVKSSNDFTNFAKKINVDLDASYYLYIVFHDDAAAAADMMMMKMIM